MTSDSKAPTEKDSSSLPLKKRRVRGDAVQQQPEKKVKLTHLKRHVAASWGWFSGPASHLKKEGPYIEQAEKANDWREIVATKPPVSGPFLFQERYAKNSPFLVYNDIGGFIDEDEESVSHPHTLSFNAPASLMEAEESEVEALTTAAASFNHTNDNCSAQMMNAPPSTVTPSPYPRSTPTDMMFSQPPHLAVPGQFRHSTTSLAVPVASRKQGTYVPPPNHLSFGLAPPPATVPNSSVSTFSTATAVHPSFVTQNVSHSRRAPHLAPTSAHALYSPLRTKKSAFAPGYAFYYK
jgi:hypothetical protein